MVGAFQSLGVTAASVTWASILTTVGSVLVNIHTHTHTVFILFIKFIMSMSVTRYVYTVYICICMTSVCCVCVQDDDECERNPCVHGQCINIPGSYYCQCPVGFQTTATRTECKGEKDIYILS